MTDPLTKKIKDLQLFWKEIIESNEYTPNFCNSVIDRIAVLNKCLNHYKEKSGVNWNFVLQETLRDNPLRGSREDKIDFCIRCNSHKIEEIQNKVEIVSTYLKGKSRGSFTSAREGSIEYNISDESFSKFLCLLDFHYDSFLRLHTIPIVEGVTALTGQAVEGVVRDYSVFRRTAEEYGRNFLLSVFFKMVI